MECCILLGVVDLEQALLLVQQGSKSPSIITCECCELIKAKSVVVMVPCCPHAQLLGMLSNPSTTRFMSWQRRAEAHEVRPGDGVGGYTRNSLIVRLTE